MQDLYDTLRDAEEKQMDEPSIVSGGGKEQLGGGVLVGLTITLQNALLAFEARSGPQFVQCFVSGGNLVAVDAVGTYFNTPIFPTAYTQVVLANSSSATLQELTLIQQSSFEGGITVDFANGFAGQEFPIGTPLNPVNNWTDAYAISQLRGLPFFFILGNATVDDTVDFSDYNFYGESKTKTRITILDAANVSGCEFHEAHVLGVLDGNSELHECVVDNLDYIEGELENCRLEAGTITLASDNTMTAHFVRCYSGVPGNLGPEIDMAGDGANLAMRSYDGTVLLKNKTGLSKVSIDFQSGKLILDNTVTAGEIVARGDGKILDTLGNEIPTGTWNGVTIINHTGEISQQEKEKIATEVWDKELGP